MILCKVASPKQPHYRNYRDSNSLLPSINGILRIRNLSLTCLGTATHRQAQRLLKIAIYAWTQVIKKEYIKRKRKSKNIHEVAFGNDYNALFL